MDVAVIGLGRMGLAMARRLAERGHAVRGWDTALGRRDEAQAAGIAVTEEAAAGAEVVVLSLPDDAAVRAVAERLPAAGLRANGAIVDTSTVSPATPRALAPRFAARGLGWIDAPVSGGPTGAAEGRLLVMAGGEAEALAAARPVLADLAAQVVHVGGPGAGAVAKLANNLLLGANLIAAVEAIGLARRAGVDPARVLEAINGASGRSAATELNLPRWILSGRFDSGFTAGLMRKDLRLAAELAAAVGLTDGLVLEAVRRWLASPVPDVADFNRVPAALIAEPEDE
ncbi:NAD(P)-dependent oxidoreductase [Elioraea thermophila]|uniref:NAD(P)-dependent oxidoreductase n=1 Tax=Elioraea thermophila TaxID=2185104 RepID=UPI000DF3948A|nr:NAD(P)-dependent oxidoreductase [Elioraea thermophila]